MNGVRDFIKLAPLI